jgi:hypothetical protein
MATPKPRKKRLSDLKATILNPATTSNFQCWLNPPQAVRTWLGDRESFGLGKRYTGNEEFYSLSCESAALPGSSLSTHEMTNDHSGVTERHAYRRQYDDRAEFSFYVDHDYNIILLFENWMSYIVNERRTPELGVSSVNESGRYSYRMNFPEGPTGYMSDIYINKFEKDYTGYLQYKFMKAFPISINTMPVSYNSSELLKCTVSFSYSRYVINSPKDVLSRQNAFEQGLIDNLSPVAGTTIVGLTGDGTISQLNRIRRSGNVAFPGVIAT